MYNSFAYVYDRLMSDIDYDALDWKENGIYYVACPMRYHKAIRYLREHLDLQKVYSKYSKQHVYSYEEHVKLAETLERIINEGSNGLICILL